MHYGPAWETTAAKISRKSILIMFAKVQKERLGNGSINATSWLTKPRVRVMTES
jgi:hypothetical protein